MAATRDVYREKPLPLKVGILMDMPERINKWAQPCYDLVKEQYLASGRLLRDIEFVTRPVFGAPTGHIQDAIDGYSELCDKGCLIVVGPNHSDNNVALVETVDQRKVPCIMLGATADNLSKHVFSLPWASIPDDAYVMTSWLKQNGFKRVAMTWDMVWHGTEYVRHFKIATARAGIEIVADYRFSVFSSDERHEKMKQIASQHRALNPDAIVHFGTGNSSVPYGKAVREIGWDVPRITNGGFFQANFEYAWEDMEGWVGTALWDEENATMMKWWNQYRERHPDDEVIAYTAEPILVWRDAMVAALEGIVLAPIMTPAGVQEGLESIRCLPAAVGGPRQSISFGQWDRRGNKGADVVVLRRCQGGRTHFEGRIQPLD